MALESGWQLFTGSSSGPLYLPTQLWSSSLKVAWIFTSWSGKMMGFERSVGDRKIGTFTSMFSAVNVFLSALTVTSTSMGCTGSAAPGSFTKQPPPLGSVTGLLPPVFILFVAGSISKSHENVPSPFSLQTACFKLMPLSITCACTNSLERLAGAFTRMLVSRPCHLAAPVLSPLAMHSAPAPLGVEA